MLLTHQAVKKEDVVICKYISHMLIINLLC